MQLHLNCVGLFKVIVFVGFFYLGYIICYSRAPFPPVKIQLRDLVSYAVMAAHIGGHAVVKIFEENSLNTVVKSKNQFHKDDLLTRADLVSNFLMLETLQRFPGLKIISEEEKKGISDSEALRYQSDRHRYHQTFHNLISVIPSHQLSLSDISLWLDPLDATQEFTEGMVEYVTMMVCVAERGRPILGVIHRPFVNETLIGLVGHGIYNGNGKKIEFNTSQSIQKSIVISRSHGGSVRNLAESAFGSDFNVEVAGGSGYKVLRLLNASAQIYLHNSNIKKWDICAGDALLASIGGSMIDLNGALIDYSYDCKVLHEAGLFAAIKWPYALFNRLRRTYTKSI